MGKVTIRYQRISDAKRFHEILRNPNFIYFEAKPKSVEDEKKWLYKNPSKRKKNIEYNYSIIYDNKVVGAIGIKVNQERKYIGEFGYFVDEMYWGQGIAPRAVRLIEKVGFKQLKLKRLEAIIMIENKASERVVIKCGYEREGTLRKMLKDRRGKLHDAHIYARVV